MAEPHRKSGSFQVHVSYSFDRLLEPKLAQAYEILVPCRERPLTLPRPLLDTYLDVLWSRGYDPPR